MICGHGIERTTCPECDAMSGHPTTPPVPPSNAAKRSASLCAAHLQCPRHGRKLVDDCPGCRVIRLKRMEDTPGGSLLEDDTEPAARQPGALSRFWDSHYRDSREAS